MRIRLSILPFLPDLFLIFLNIIIFSISLADPTSASFYYNQPQVEIRFDPPILGKSVLTMGLKRYHRRNDRFYGHIHFDRWQIVKSASIVEGPLNTVCYLEHGMNLGLKDFNFYEPFKGYALTGFVTCLVRDAGWELE